jgi:hypothetical protein
MQLDTVPQATAELSPATDPTDLMPDADTISSDSENMTEAGLSDEDCTYLAAQFACADYTAQDELADDGEEVDLFEWEDDDPLLADQQLETRLLKYLVAVDEELSEEEWLPADILYQRKRQRKEKKGEYQYELQNTKSFMFNRSSYQLWQGTWACK